MKKLTKQVQRRPRAELAKALILSPPAKVVLRFNTSQAATSSNAVVLGHNNAMASKHKSRSAYHLTPDDERAWATLVDAGRRLRAVKGKGSRERGRVDKDGGINLNKDDESHERARAYLVLMASRKMRVRDAVAQTGMDWVTMSSLRNSCQDYHDAYCAMLDAQKARMRDSAASLVDGVMDGDDVSNAQGRMAAWALERLDEDYRPVSAASAASAASAPQLGGGGIVINLISSACSCDNPVTTGPTMDVTPVTIESAKGLVTPEQMPALTAEAEAEA